MVLGLSAALFVGLGPPLVRSAAAQQNPPPPPVGRRAPAAEMILPGQAPPADRPLIQRVPPAAISVEAGGGVVGYIGGTARPGPGWNVRATFAFTPRWAVEGNYTGAVNGRSDNTGSLTYTALDVDARFNLLLADRAPVQPFLAAGLGYAGWGGPGGDAASLTIPVAVGAERLLTEHIKVGAHFALRPAFFENLGYGGEKSTPGGSTWSVVGNVGGAF